MQVCRSTGIAGIVKWKTLRGGQSQSLNAPYDSLPRLFRYRENDFRFPRFRREVVKTCPQI